MAFALDEPSARLTRQRRETEGTTGEAREGRNEGLRGRTDNRKSMMHETATHTHNVNQPEGVRGAVPDCQAATYYPCREEQEQLALLA